MPGDGVDAGIERFQRQYHISWIGGIDSNQFAYRIDSNTAVITIGYNRIMTPDISLDFSARFVDSEAKDDSDIYYERTIFRASLLGRF